MPNLQILRFVAAALVLISHVQHEALKGAFIDLSTYQPWNAIYFAGGVDIFFVISGFIMYAIASGDFGAPGAAQRFFARRVVRIVPPYWIFTAAMIGAVLLFSNHVTHTALSLDHILASFFFIPFENAYGRAYPMLMLGWTLNYEFYFYVVFTLALLLPKRLGLALLFGLIGTAGLCGMALLVQQQPFAFWSDPITLEFLFGICLAMARERGWRLPPIGCWLLALAGVLAMWLTMAVGIAGHYWNFRCLWMGLPALAICASVVLARAQQRPPGPIKRQLVLWGDASYAIYLSHPFALNLVALLYARAGLHNPWLYVAVACLFSLLVGVLVHLWLEKPLTAYLNRRLNRYLPPQSKLATLAPR